MGKDKKLVGVILILDLLLLTIAIVGYVTVLIYLRPGVLFGLTSIPSILATYLISYLASYSLAPSIVQERIVKTEDIIKRTFLTSALTLLFVSLATLLIRPYNYFPRSFTLSTITLFFFLLTAERIIIRKFLQHARTNNKNTKSIILIGKEPTVISLFKTFSTPAYGYNVIGTFFDGNCDDHEYASLRIGGINDVYKWIANNNYINEIYGYFPKEQQVFISMISKFCDNHLIRFFYVPAIDVFEGNISFSFAENIPLIARREEPLSNIVNKIIKRAFDILFSTVVLVFFFPWIWLIVAIIIKITSPGPVFFIQERTGLDGKIFKCIKFRSMKVNDDADKVQATKDDPRKFPFGDFMRKTNIDELPQFINVFIGDMSIVGPRPHMLKHTEEYSKLISRFMVRHLAKPGITGLAQVSGFRGETKYIDQMEGRVKKDIEYIENWTFLLDIKIIVKTITNVIFNQEKGNAY